MPGGFCSGSLLSAPVPAPAARPQYSLWLDSLWLDRECDRPDRLEFGRLARYSQTSRNGRGRVAAFLQRAAGRWSRCDDLAVLVLPDAINCLAATRLQAFRRPSLPSQSLKRGNFCRDASTTIACKPGPPSSGSPNHRHRSAPMALGTRPLARPVRLNLAVWRQRDYVIIGGRGELTRHRNAVILEDRLSGGVSISPNSHHWLRHPFGSVRPQIQGPLTVSGPPDLFPCLDVAVAALSGT